MKRIDELDKQIQAIELSTKRTLATTPFLLGVVIIAILIVGFVFVKLFIPAEQNKTIQSHNYSNNETISLSETYAEDITHPTDYNGQNEEDPIKQMISETHRQLEPFLQFLGAEVRQDGNSFNLDVSPEIIEQSKHITVMGIEGTVTSAFSSDDRKKADLLNWQSNEEQDRNEFPVFLALLNQYFGKQGEEINNAQYYWKLNQSTAVWAWPKGDHFIICWQQK